MNGQVLAYGLNVPVAASALLIINNYITITQVVVAVQ